MYGKMFARVIWESVSLSQLHKLLDGRRAAAEERGAERHSAVGPACQGIDVSFSFLCLFSHPFLMFFFSIRYPSNCCEDNVMTYGSPIFVHFERLLIFVHHLHRLYITPIDIYKGIWQKVKLLEHFIRCFDHNGSMLSMAVMAMMANVLSVRHTDQVWEHGIWYFAGSSSGSTTSQDGRDG
jgi:hypothetical protein